MRKLLILICLLFSGLFVACNRSQEEHNEISEFIFDLDESEAMDNNMIENSSDGYTDIKVLENDNDSSDNIISENQQENSLNSITEEAMDIAIDSIGEIENPKIVIKKSNRALELWDGEELRVTFPIGLGWNPIGDKQKEGDGCTPEGTYYVCTRNEKSSFYLSLGVSYPNKEDAKEALDKGLIDQSAYTQIKDAIDSKESPPWYTPMGGEIMIHGRGSHSDWTAGCVAVEDDIMDVLWDNCPMGTPIIIEP